jgi:DNA primase
MRIPPHIIDDIMNTARIEEVIGEYVNLKRAGSSLKGLSPFTDEKTPSFMVSPAKQIFKCFSTGKGGTVVTFLMEQEQFSYPEALKWLANRYNIELPKEKPLTPEEKAELTERESLSIINDYARDFFHQQLKESEEGKAIGLSYFKERGFSDEIIDQFQLGYCPRSEGSFTETALKKGYKQEYLETLGLTKTKDGRSFDFFSGRVLFPIHSVSGKVLGFGGRTLQTNTKVAKYFNSPESIIYDKSNILYGMYFAKSDIIKYDNCFLVEGYTDVISLAQSGVTNVVASSGTSLTNGQIKLIKRYTNNITILYDGDAAGIKASFRGIDLILAAGMNVQVVLFPDGDDPDSYAKKVSKEELSNYIETAKKDFVSFKTDLLLSDTDDDPIQRARVIKDIASSIALIPDTISRTIFIKSTAKLLAIDEQILTTEVSNTRRKNATPTTHPTVTPTDDELINKLTQNTTSQEVETKTGEPQRNFYEQELDVIRILVLYGSRAIELNQLNEKQETIKIETSVSELITYEIIRDELSFDTPHFQEIFMHCVEGIENNILYDPSYFLRVENQKIVKVVSDFLSPKHELSTTWFDKFKIDTSAEIHRVAQAVRETLYAFKNAKVQSRLLAIQELLNPNNENYQEDKTTDLITEQIQLQKIKRTFAEELGRIII